MTTRALLFDLDDTLIDRLAAMRAVIRGWIDEAAPASATDAERASWLDQAMQLDNRGYTPRRAFWSGLFALPAFADAGRETYDKARFRRDLLAAIAPEERVLTMLDTLRGAYRLVLVTNGDDRMQRAKAEQAGVAARMTAIVTSGSVGEHKPSATMFEAALAAADCAPSVAVMIGDNPSADIGGAASLGIRTVWISHHRDWPADVLTLPTHISPNIAAVADRFAAEPEWLA